MKTLQDKFFEQLDARAAEKHLEVVVSYSYANVGTLHLQPEGSFETVLSLRFDFQSYTTRFGIVGGREIFQGPNPHVAAFKPAELDRALDAILAYAEENLP